MSSNGERPPGSAEKSLGDIVAEVSEKASQLVREEIELAKAEVTDKLKKLGRGAGVGVAAGVFAVFGVTMFFFFLAFILNDAFDWNGVWPGFLVVTVLLFLLAAIAGLLAARWLKSGAPPTPDLAIEEAKKTREQLEAQTIERDQVSRSLERGKEVGA